MVDGTGPGDDDEVIKRESLLKKVISLNGLSSLHFLFLTLRIKNQESIRYLDRSRMGFLLKAHLSLVSLMGKSNLSHLTL